MGTAWNFFCSYNDIGSFVSGKRGGPGQPAVVEVEDPRHRGTACS